MSSSTGLPLAQTDTGNVYLWVAIPPILPVNPVTLITFAVATMAIATSLTENLISLALTIAQNTPAKPTKIVSSTLGR